MFCFWPLIQTTRQVVMTSKCRQYMMTGANDF
jgi:hypothetical protein